MAEILDVVKMAPQRGGMGSVGVNHSFKLGSLLNFLIVFIQNHRK